MLGRDLKVGMTIKVHYKSPQKYVFNYHSILKMIPFDQVWAASDNEDLSVTFDLSTDVISAAIRVQQADDEDNGLLMSVIVRKQVRNILLHIYILQGGISSGYSEGTLQLL